jgi:hypothetical protein
MIPRTPDRREDCAGQSFRRSVEYAPENHVCSKYEDKTQAEQDDARRCMQEPLRNIIA